AELVRYGEELGYEFAILADRRRDVFVTLTLAAQATSRIQLWCGVVNPYVRHPIINANAIATVDELAPGRLVLGYGAGNVTELVPQMGFDRRRSYERVHEAIQIVRQALDQSDVQFEGKHFRANGEELGLKTEHKIPIFVAGNGPRMLAVGGELADGVITQYTNPTLFTKAMEAVRRGAERGGKDPSGVEVVWEGALVVTDEDIEKPSDAVPLSWATNCLLFTPPKWLEEYGVTAETLDRIRESYRVGAHVDAKTAASYERELLEEGIVTEDMVDMYSIAGSPAQCAARIRALEELGLTKVALWISTSDPDGKREIIRSVAEKLVPLFR
ncbi:MAG: LLM class flavin-dependent oxidoreductase, partial [Nitrospinota bacterium]|nr:LLM class flavin-dependent oxidoreductase [Nitrospinota bacterium]